MKYFFLIFILSSKLFAKDCDGLKEGELIRLDAPGKSLEKFKMQDQDGMGTCYANATSLLLHSVLPKHPTVSYLQLASINKEAQFDYYRNLADTSKNGDYEIYTKKSTDENGKKISDLGINFGDVCELIDAVKSHQASTPGEGLCLSQSINIEKILSSGDANDNQHKSMMALSEYMNGFQQKFSAAVDKKKYTPDELKKHEKTKKDYLNFKFAFQTEIGKKQKNFEKDCQKLNPDMFYPLLNNLKSGLLENSYCFKKNGKYDNVPTCKLVKKILNTTKSPDGQLNASFKPEFLDSFYTIFSNKNAIIDGKAILNNSQASLSNLVEAPIDLNTNIDIESVIKSINPEDADQIAKNINEFNKSGVSKSCEERKLINYLGSNDFLVDASNNTTLCSSLGLINNIQTVVNTTAATNLANISKVSKFVLKDANLDFKTAIIGLFAVDCNPQNKIKIPENLKCEHQEVLISKKAEINKKILAELKADHAMTATILGPAIDKKKAEMSEDDKQNRHIVGISGLKCVEGKLKYLVQNSWGKRSARNSEIENDLNEDGKFWLNEETFFDNCSYIQTIGMK